jgi:hypothetical protein
MVLKLTIFPLLPPMVAQVVLSPMVQLKLAEQTVAGVAGVQLLLVQQLAVYQQVL